MAIFGKGATMRLLENMGIMIELERRLESLENDVNVLSDFLTQAVSEGKIADLHNRVQSLEDFQFYSSVVINRISDELERLKVRG